MTVQTAAELYGISKQAIYQRLKTKGIDIRQLKTKAGDLTEEGERLFEELFDRTSVTSEGEESQQPTLKEKQKQHEASLLQAQKQVEALTFQVDSLQKEVNFLKREVESVRDERDYLRRALDQSQQLQAMTMRMLPPSPAERRSVFSWLTSRFTKPAPTSDQQKPEETL